VPFPHLPLGEGRKAEKLFFPVRKFALRVPLHCQIRPLPPTATSQRQQGETIVSVKPQLTG
jgi:hypothetical protein